MTENLPSRPQPTPGPGPHDHPVYVQEGQPNQYPAQQYPQAPSQPYQYPPQQYPQTPGQPYQHPVQQFPPQQVSAKSPGVALLASFFFPGLGTLMNGQVGKGIVIFVGYFFSWILTLVLIGIVGVVGFWVWGMVDAYQGAQKWNTAHGIIS